MYINVFGPIKVLLLFQIQNGDTWIFLGLPCTNIKLNDKLTAVKAQIFGKT